jgi:hypothetical protein
LVQQFVASPLFPLHQRHSHHRGLMNNANQHEPNIFIEFFPQTVGRAFRIFFKDSAHLPFKIWSARTTKECHHFWMGYL